jgi:hypothetical protein
MSLKLRDYQTNISILGATILEEYKMLYLAMACRTGKSITAFETAKLAGWKRVLVVSKKKALEGLMGDYTHYTLDFQASFINYESVHKVVGEFDGIIVDEAHSIGAFPKPSNRAKAMKEVAKDLPIIYLSATPTPESFSQIFHQMYISSFSPFEANSFYKWARSFVNVKQRKIAGRMVNDYSDADEAKISKGLDPFMITFTQEQSGFDVSIQERFIHCDMSPSQTFLIKKLKEDNIYEGKSGGVVIADTAVKMQQKIHQICSGTIKLEDGSRYVLSKNKGNAIKSTLGDKNIAIFYKFIGEFEMLKEVFPNWTTDQTEFQDSEDKVYLGQFVSSREGVRLDTADCIVFLNIDFSYLSYAQARERIVSKERIDSAILYWVFSNGGIEEKIYKSVMLKENYTVSHFKKDYSWKKK